MAEPGFEPGAAGREAPFNRDVTRKFLLLALGFEPTTLQLTSSSYGVTLLAGICITPINKIARIGKR